MSLEIVTFPHPALKEQAQPVECFDEELKQLVAEMTTLMHAHEGVGLAATQVGVSRQLLLLSSYAFLSPEERAKAAEDPSWEGEVFVVINPRVTAQSEEQELDYEGCLSFPEVYIKVSRPKRVMIEAFDVEGAPITLEGEGFGARAILHEMDHLSGKVMTDHLSYLARQSALNKHRRVQKARAASRGAEGKAEADTMAAKLSSQGSVRGTVKRGAKAGAKRAGKAKKKR